MSDTLPEKTGFFWAFTGDKPALIYLYFKITNDKDGWTALDLINQTEIPKKEWQFEKFDINNILPPLVEDCWGKSLPQTPGFYWFRYDFQQNRNPHWRKKLVYFNGDIYLDCLNRWKHKNWDIPGDWTIHPLTTPKLEDYA